MFGVDLISARTPPIRAWFHYGTSRAYLDDHVSPLDLVQFRNALGTALNTKQPEASGEPGGRRGGAPAVASGLREKPERTERTMSTRPSVEGEDTESKEGGLVEESGSDGGQDEGEEGDGRKSKAVGPGQTNRRKPKKRKSPATVETSGEEDGRKDSADPTRQKDPTKRAVLGRYDPPCDRCLAQHKTDCHYSRLNNACTRCKPSKVKCSYASGSRKKLKTDKDDPDAAQGVLPIPKPKSDTPECRTPPGPERGDLNRPPSAPEKSPPPSVVPKPVPKPKRSQSNGKKAAQGGKGATSAEELGERGKRKEVEKLANADPTVRYRPPWYYRPTDDVRPQRSETWAGSRW